MSAIETMAAFSGGLERMTNKGQKDRERMAKAAARAILGGMSPDVGRQLGKAIQLFFGEDIIIRQLPCGEAHRPYAFAGVLADDGPLLRSRSALYATFGAAPSDWQLLAQVGTVPAPPATTEPEAEEPQGEESAEAEAIDRAGFEQVAAEMMSALEESGVAGGPLWPTITVTPLALYRRSQLPGPSRQADRPDAQRQS